MEWTSSLVVGTLCTYWYLIGLFVLVYLYWDYTVTYGTWKKQGIPGPTPIPFFGLNPVHVYRVGMAEYLKECVQKYGKVCGTFVGRIPVLVTADPELVKQVCIKEFSNFTNRITQVNLRRTNQNFKFLLNLKDKDWKRVRSTISPIFSAAKMKQMNPLINEGVEILIDKFGESATRKENVNVAEKFGRFTMETIFKSAFGVSNINSQNNPDDKYFAAASESLQVSNMFIFTSFFIPVLKDLFVFIFGSTQASNKQLQVLFETAKAMIKTRRQEGHPSRTDLLRLTMEAETKSEDGGFTNKLSDEEIEGQCITFLIAGYETTANVLTFVFYILATQPDIQEKLFEEIDTFFPGDENIDFDLVNKLQYLDKVLNETLRMYPPVPHIARACKQDCTVGGIYIPKNASVAIPIMTLHNHPDIWDQPEVFDPERFSPEGKASRHEFAHIPFSLGPRNCVGMRFAILEAKSAMIQVLRKYRFEATPETQLKVNTRDKGAFILADGGIFLRVIKRTDV